MQEIKITELVNHPRNTEFFDDMAGEKWNEFLESVKSRGVIEPVIITQDKVIVSGHQRVRACKELGINDVLCETRIYNNEDEILQDLIETNVRQRGDVGGSQLKLGRRIVELERLYGIKHGNNQHSYEEDLHNVPILTQEELANKLGISKRTLNNAKKLTTLPQEIQDMVEVGKITSSTASRVIAKLTKEEQQLLIDSFDTNKKVSDKEVKQYIEKIKSLENELAKRPTVEITKEVQVTPSDYEITKKELSDYKKDYSDLQNKYYKTTEDLNLLKRNLNEKEKNSPKEQYAKKIKDSTLIFCAKVSSFIEEVGGYIWLTDKINEIPELEKNGYIKAVETIKDWADTMDYNIKNNGGM